MKKRVVITGMGCVSALGLNISTFEKNLFRGNSGIHYLSELSFEGCSVRIGGLVKDCPLESINYELKILSRLDPFMVYGIKAGIEAIEQSGLPDSKSDPSRIGVIVGSGIGGLSTIEKQTLSFEQKGSRSVSPFFIPSTLANMVSGHLAIKYGYHGPNLSLSTACTTGLQTILQAYDLIKNDYADVMIAGGSEHSLTPLGIAGFAAARALSNNNDNPKEASRPFDSHRDGFVMADGSGAVVVEELEHALARGARIFGEILGGGYSGDAYHMTQPHPEGYGAKLAMRSALARADLKPKDIEALNPHATSTPLGDRLELEAIKDVFGESSHRLWVFPTKGLTGHLLGASGALESIICLLALQRQELPPALNLTNPDPLCHQFSIPRDPHTPVNIRTIMNNSFAFGGANTSVIFQRFEN